MGRGINKHERSKYDYYVTPQKDIEVFLKAFTKDCGNVFTGKTILDPCAGGDAKHEMSYPTVIRKMFNQHTITADIRKDSRASVKIDYLNHVYNGKADVIITNPPFNKALEFIKKSLQHSRGYVIMLLRLSFLESKTRFDFFQNNMPTYIYVHHKRISFTDDGKTDSAAYAHFVWEKGKNPEFAKIKII